MALMVGFLCLLLFLPWSLASSSSSVTGDSCEPIKMPLCQSVGYNMTRMPNLAGHRLQAYANNEVLQGKTIDIIINLGITPWLIAATAVEYRYT